MGGESIVVRRGEHGWRVGDEQAADLTSAMVLADLLAADLGDPVLGQLTSLVLASNLFGHSK